MKKIILETINGRKINLMKNRLTIFTTVLSVLACVAFLPQIKAAPQVAPPPDGCYPGFTTAEGCNALLHLGTGAGNTGVGWYSLFFAGDSSFNTGVGAGTLVLNTGDNNTAVGAAALLLNTTGDDNTAVGTDALALNVSAFTNVGVGTFAAQNNDSSGSGMPSLTRLWAALRSELTLMAPETPPLVLVRSRMQRAAPTTPRLGR
jgi:hypothetical protein